MVQQKHYTYIQLLCSNALKDNLLKEKRDNNRDTNLTKLIKRVIRNLKDKELEGIKVITTLKEHKA